MIKKEILIKVGTVIGCVFLFGIILLSIYMSEFNPSTVSKIPEQPPTPEYQRVPPPTETPFIEPVMTPTVGDAIVPSPIVTEIP